MQMCDCVWTLKKKQNKHKNSGLYSYQAPFPRHFSQDTVPSGPDEECVVYVTPTRFSL